MGEVCIDILNNLCRERLNLLNYISASSDDIENKKDNDYKNINLIINPLFKINDKQGTTFKEFRYNDTVSFLICMISSIRSKICESTKRWLIKNEVRLFKLRLLDLIEYRQEQLWEILEDYKCNNIINIHKLTEVEWINHKENIFKALKLDEGKQ